MLLFFDIHVLLRSTSVRILHTYIIIQNTIDVHSFKGAEEHIDVHVTHTFIHFNNENLVTFKGAEEHINAHITRAFDHLKKK